MPYDLLPPQPAGPAPTVSVAMITFQHEAFIAQAIESVLRQQTNFPVELVIGEDCSPDRTRQIVLDYQRRHPGKIRLLLWHQNGGMMQNARQTLHACRGEFVAPLEGDDYWLGTEKLQRQVDFLRAHPDCSMCFHDVVVAEGNAGHGTRRFLPSKPPALATTADILAYNFVPTCSVVFRRDALPPLPAPVQRLSMQDWPMWVLLSRAGSLAFLDEVWGCYRLHAGGAWSSRSHEKQLRGIIQFYETMFAALPADYRGQIRSHLKAALAGLVEELVVNGHWRDARRPALRYLWLPPRRWRTPAGRAGLYCRLLFGRPSAVMLKRGLVHPMAGPLNSR